MVTIKQEDVKIFRPPLYYLLIRLFLAGSKKQAFLDRRWVGWLIRVTPNIFRKRMILELLALSPHYFVYQWSTMYPKSLPRREILNREYQRNKETRREICEKLLKPYIRAGMTVLDFGCGPGFLAKEVSTCDVNVTGSDVSVGTIACAKFLHSADCLSFTVNQGKALDNVNDNTIDIVYSFAVFQHLEKEQIFIFLKEFSRVLKEKGFGICHFAVNGSDNVEKTEYQAWKKWFVKRLKYPMNYLPKNFIESLLTKAGFDEISIVPIANIAKLDDDIGTQHLAIFRKKVK